MRRTRQWRVVLFATVALTAAATLLLVLASPLALPLLDDASERDWQRLSEIGQTYGAVSALLSALALGGVVASLALQRQSAALDRRSANLDRELAYRSVHMELLMLGIQNPELLDMFGRWGSAESPEQRRMYAYINLWVSFWAMQFDVGRDDALGGANEELRHAAEVLFLSPVGRQWWSDVRTTRPARSDSMRLFHQMLEEHWQQATEHERQQQASSAAAPSPQPHEPLGGTSMAQSEEE